MPTIHEALDSMLVPHGRVMVVYACNHNTLELKAGRPEVEVIPWLKV